MTIFQGRTYSPPVKSGSAVRAANSCLLHSLNEKNLDKSRASTVYFCWFPVGQEQYRNVLNLAAVPYLYMLWFVIKYKKEEWFTPILYSFWIPGALQHVVIMIKCWHYFDIFCGNLFYFLSNSVFWITFVNEMRMVLRRAKFLCCILAMPMYRTVCMTGFITQERMIQEWKWQESL